VTKPVLVPFWSRGGHQLVHSERQQYRVPGDVGQAPHEYRAVRGRVFSLPLSPRCVPSPGTRHRPFRLCPQMPWICMSSLADLTVRSRSGAFTPRRRRSRFAPQHAATRRDSEPIKVRPARLIGHGQTAAVQQRPRDGPAKDRERSRTESKEKRPNALVKAPIRDIVAGQRRGLKRIPKPRVAGSIPAGGTNLRRHDRD
jgi:hypothetical protein